MEKDASISTLTIDFEKLTGPRLAATGNRMRFRVSSDALQNASGNVSKDLVEGMRIILIH
jgi:hypothetical protein